MDVISFDNPGKGGKQPGPQGRRGPVLRFLPYLAAAALLVAGAFAYWKFVYEPSETLSTFMHARVNGIYSDPNQLPRKLHENASKLEPRLFEALEGADPEKAAVAFVTLRHACRLNPSFLGSFRSKRLSFEGEGEGKFRVALLVEWSSKAETDSLDEIGFPPGFAEEYALWKCRVGGPFQLKGEDTYFAMRQLLAINPKTGFSVALEALRGGMQRNFTMAIAAEVASSVFVDEAAIDETYRTLQEMKLDTTTFLRVLRSNPAAPARKIMLSAFTLGDPFEQSVAVEYLASLNDPEVVSLLAKSLVSDDLLPEFRMVISRGFLGSGQERLAATVVESLGSWPPADVVKAMKWTRLKREHLLRFLAAAAGLKEPMLKREACANWVLIEGQQAFRPLEAVRATGSPMSRDDLVPAAKGLAGRSAQHRADFAVATATVLGFSRIVGTLDADSDLLGKAALAAMDYLSAVPAGMDPEKETRRMLVSAAGSVLHGLWPFHADRAALSDRLSESAARAGETDEVRFEAAYWLACSGFEGTAIAAILREGTACADARLRHACATGLAFTGDSEGLDFLVKAMSGENAVHQYLAACECVRVPVTAFEKLLPALAAMERSKLEVPAAAARNALMIFMCENSALAPDDARRFIEAGTPGALWRKWMAKAAVSPGPPEPGCLADAAAAIDSADVEKSRAANNLLARWTDAAVGMDYWCGARDHGREISGRWKKWLDEHAGKPEWNGETGMFEWR